MTPDEAPVGVESAVPPWARRAGESMHRLDVAAYRAVARMPAHRLDVALTRLASAADYSRLSFVVAAGLAGFGGARGRRAARDGLLALGLASALANIGGKLLARRARPAREEHGVVVGRHVRMPASASFPSGHSACAFAFSTGVGQEWPAAAVPLHALAAAVGFSRVHTGVHYPGDVLAGCAIGVASARGVATALARRHVSVTA